MSRPRRLEISVHSRVNYTIRKHVVYGINYIFFVYHVFDAALSESIK